MPSSGANNNLTFCSVLICLCRTSCSSDRESEPDDVTAEVVEVEEEVELLFSRIPVVEEEDDDDGRDPEQMGKHKKAMLKELKNCEQTRLGVFFYFFIFYLSFF